MAAKLSVIFYIVLCLEIGLVLTLGPWVPQGWLGSFSDWGNNYFLLYATQKTGLFQLQSIVASGWVRGAVSGVGILNLGIAFWEIFHFKQSVRALQASAYASTPAQTNVASTTKADHLPHNERQDTGSDNQRF